MDILNPTEIQALVNNSTMARKYNEVIDRESAFEILEKRLKDHDESETEGEEEEEKKAEKPTKEEPSTFEKLSKNTMVRQVGRTVASALTRGLLGVLGVKTTTRRRKSGGLFG